MALLAGQARDFDGPAAAGDQRGEQAPLGAYPVGSEPRASFSAGRIVNACKLQCKRL
jgi:hypothetical protein